jgi:predicted AAA+ superfamily ATPase
LRLFPAVTLVGPRQCGKTTLARTLGTRYYDMEAEGDRVRLDAEWNVRVQGDELTIIDEAQQAPELFPRLRGAIDADRKRNGRFLLLGSVSPTLMVNVSESLAGRMAVMRLSPLILPELEDAGQTDALWLHGGYPDGGILYPAMFPEWQRSYLDLLVSRDLPAWGLSAKPRQTLRLLAMLAAVHGQPINASQLGASMSLDHKTVVRHCDFLEEAFLIRRIAPFSANIRKRLVKTPRLYWRDSGLLHALMHVGDMDQLYRQPWLGQSWEGFVVEQTLAALETVGRSVQPFYFRTSDGFELDLVLDWGDTRWAIEIKLTSNPSCGEFERLEKTADLIGADRRVLISRTVQDIETDRLWSISLDGWLRRLLAKPCMEMDASQSMAAKETKNEDRR